MLLFDARSLSDLPRMAAKIEDSAQIPLLFCHLFTNKLLKIMKILSRTSNFSLIRGKPDRLLGAKGLLVEDSRANLRRIYYHGF